MAYPGPGPSQHYAPQAARQPAGAYGQLSYQPPAPAQDSQRLRSLADLPECFRPAFAGGFRFFNPVQSESWQEVYESSMSVVLSAPTGSGKTVVMELAVLSLLRRHIDPAGAFCHKPGLLKSIYLSPTRALVQEKVRDWERRFGPLGITCKEVTGDSGQEDLQGVDEADIICTTPEKFDAMTRRHRDHGGMRFFNEIALVLIDEVHLLTENRGAALEAGVISRIKMVSSLREMKEQPIGKVRFVAVSATIPNIGDIAAWLGAPPAGIKCFGEEMRPVKLRTIVRGYNPTKTPFLFERRLNDYLPGIIAEYSKGKPSLVFCSSRKGAEETAAAVAKEAARHGGGRGGGGFVRDAAHHTRLVAVASQFPKNPHLRDCIAVGVGFHHAAMLPEERSAVEQLFLATDLLVLCTTSTLAMGVNLPAHLVVIKSTRRYVGSEAEDPTGYEEYERSTCLQMVGRAGRPQFDTEGVAVVMTQRQSVPRYEQLVKGSETVESTLKEPLPEYLNAEICLRTINDVSRAIDWLKSTFLYVRIRRNPAAYAVPQQVVAGGGDAIDRWLKERLVLTTIGQLTQHGLVRTDEEGFGLEPLQPGVIMAENYIRMETMISLCSTPKGAAMPDLIGAIAKCAELSNLKLRRSEKKVLNEVNHGEGQRHKVMDAARPDRVLERISTGADKIFILVNAGLSDRPPDKLDYSLKCDMEQAVSVGARLAAAMVRYFTHAGRASETFNSLLLLKSLRQRLWSGSTHETRQLPGIGPTISERLAEAGVHSLRQLAAVDPRRLENMAQRHFPFGNEVRDALRQLMPPTVAVECTPLAWTPGGLLDLEIKVTRVEETGNPSLRSGARLLVGTLHDNALLLTRSLCLESFASPLVVRTRTRSSGRGTVGPLQVVTSVVHERLLGMDVAIKTAVPQHVRLGGRAPAGGAASSVKSGDEVGAPPVTPGNDELEGGAAQTSLESDGGMLPAACEAEERAAGALSGTSALEPLGSAQAGRGQRPEGPARVFMQLQQEQPGPKGGKAVAKAVAGVRPAAAAKPAGGRLGQAPLQAIAAAKPGGGASGWGSFLERPPAKPLQAQPASGAGSRAWQSRPFGSAAAGQAATGRQGRPAAVQPAAPALRAASPLRAAAAVAPSAGGASAAGGAGGLPFSQFAFSGKRGLDSGEAAPPRPGGPSLAALPRKRSAGPEVPPQQGSKLGGNRPGGGGGASGQGDGGALPPSGAKAARVIIPKLAWLSGKYAAAASAAPGGSTTLEQPRAAPAPALEPEADYSDAFGCI